jgi:DNA modification methylase
MTKFIRQRLNKIICGDALQTLKNFPSNSIDCAIFSPPYWQLRDYRWKGQWGLEKTFEEYLQNLWKLVDELKRVLKQEGTVWVNLGDTYGTQSGTSLGFKFEISSTIPRKENGSLLLKRKVPHKSLLLIPHRFAIGCLERGWLVRNDIIWAKPNGMPESTKDRFTKKHEYIFLLTKNKKYYFDLDSIREEYKQSSLDRANRGISENNKWINGADGQQPYNLSQPRLHRTKINSKDAEKFGSPRARYYRGKKYWSNSIHPKGKNPGDVSDFWVISTKPNSHKHFAAFNRDLITKPILAGCPINGIVLDPFCGVGTTGVRAIELGRYFIGIEGKKAYCRIASKNIGMTKKLSVI